VNPWLRAREDVLGRGCGGNMTKLYLQEQTRIIGMHPNRRLFARAIVRYATALNAHAQPRPWRNVGIWELVGMTGSWAQVLGLYEFSDGWRTLGEMIRQTMQSPAAELAETYRAVESLRSGGSDELLLPLEGCPTYDELCSRGAMGPLLIVERVEVEPGHEAHYGQRLLTEWLPRASEYGHRLLGLYRGALAEGWVLSYWATDLARFSALRQSGAAQCWLDGARPDRRGWRQELWTAAPGSRYADPAFDYGERDIREP
jgi:hypothetical protein